MYAPENPICVLSRLVTTDLSRSNNQNLMFCNCPWNILPLCGSQEVFILVLHAVIFISHSKQLEKHLGALVRNAETRKAGIPEAFSRHVETANHIQNKR